MGTSQKNPGSGGRAHGTGARPIDVVLGKLRDAKPNGGGWQAKCPAHDDQNASLSVREGDDARALVHCHAGCSCEQVVTALGLSMADLFTSGNGKGRSVIVCEYDYRSADGVLLYQSVRFVPKDFRLRKPDGNSGWTWSLGDTPRILYRLPDLIAADANTTAYLAEGEKDVDNLRALGLVATCNPMGAGKWGKLSDDSALNGRRVCIIADADKAGRDHAQDVARRLFGRAREIRVVEVPTGKDATDYIDALRADGKDNIAIRASIKALAEQAPALSEAPADPYSKSRDADVAVEPRPEPHHLTDAGNGELFAEQHRGRVCFDATVGDWRVWTGQRWDRDARGVSMQLAKATARSLLLEAHDAPDRDRSAKLAKHALQSEGRERLRAMLDLARTEPGMTRLPDEWDSNLWLLNVTNGTIELHTGELRPHDPHSYITKLAPVVYDAGAECPKWTAFLDHIFDGNADLIQYVQRWLGYCLTGDIAEQILPVCHGTGANGKSTLLDTVVWTMGDYAGQAPPDLLLASYHDSHPTEIADLLGKRLVVASESEKHRRLRVQLMKRLTGDATLKGRFMRQDFFSFPRTSKIVLQTNNRPRVDEDTEAVWRRLRLVPFNVTIPPQERDQRLADKLKAEAPGILRWLVQGCLGWQQSGLAEPAIVNAATLQYRDDSDPFSEFLNECAIVAPNAWCASARLRQEYERFCQERGDTPLSGREYGDALRKRGCADTRRAGLRGWAGIGLLALNISNREPVLTVVA